MAKQYPYICGFDSYTYPVCKICKEQIADGAFVVQFNWFRGDDELIKSCIGCYDHIKKNPEELNKLFHES